MSAGSSDIDWSSKARHAPGKRSGSAGAVVPGVAAAADDSSSNGSEIDWSARRRCLETVPAAPRQSSVEPVHPTEAANKNKPKRSNKHTRKEQAERASKAAQIARLKRNNEALEQKAGIREATDSKASESSMCVGMSFAGSNFTELGKRNKKSRTWVKHSRSKTLNSWLEAQEELLQFHMSRIREAGGAFLSLDTVPFDCARHTFTLRSNCFDVEGDQ